MEVIGMQHQVINIICFASVSWAPGFVALYLDSIAISQDMEMMGGLLVTKAHSLVAPCIHASEMVLWAGAGRLALCADAEKAQDKASECSEPPTTHSFRHALLVPQAAKFAKSLRGLSVGRESTFAVDISVDYDI